MDLNTNLTEIPKIGPRLAKRLKKLKLHTVEDLIYHIPFRYEDAGKPKKIREIKIGEKASLIGKVVVSKNVRTRFGKSLTFATISDRENDIEAVWFNQPFLTKTIKGGVALSLAGKIDLFNHKPTFINPEYEIIPRSSRKSIHTQGLVPIYPETAGLSSKWLRSKIKEILPIVLPNIQEILPQETLDRNKLLLLRTALWQVHSPTNTTQIEEARRRLAFDEILLTIIEALIRKHEWKEKFSGVQISVYRKQTFSLISNLPFELTKAQTRVLKEILTDIEKDRPMNRLLQGDVGSGKTIIAAVAAYNVALNGLQAAYMAPTEILALQHFETLKRILSPLGIKLALSTSGIKKGDDSFDIIVGTHTLLSKSTSFQNLGLVIIDEQHRFGVEQRATLRGKGTSPHVLTMTATPIPRSLALTFYGDLDISVLDELPKNRKIVKTYVVPPEKRPQAYQFVEKHIKDSEQVFIICPLIEPSETLESVKAATDEYERLQRDVFPKRSLSLLHGKIKSKEKEKILKGYLNRKFDILVATPVVEVGIDIPNASFMIIEAADRFGLASLHQLRGRVGRGTRQSYCLLFTESKSRKALTRLKALESNHIGLKLAELDLKIRGPGQIFGTAQSGIPNFKIADINDLPLIKRARDEAKLLVRKNVISVPPLSERLERQKLVAPD